MKERRTAEDFLVVAGSRDAWFERCEQALEAKGFTRIEVNRNIAQIKAGHKPIVGTVHGDIILTLLPADPNTRINIRATAAVDKLYAFAGSPTDRLIQKFKAGLAALDVPLIPLSSSPASISSEIAELSHLETPENEAEGAPNVAPGSTGYAPTQRTSSDDRKDALLHAVNVQIAQGARVESQSEYTAVLVKGRRPNHLLHFLIGVFTLGMWWLIWILLTLTGGEKRTLVSVDASGYASVQTI